MEHSFCERWMSSWFKKFGRTIATQPGAFLFVSLLVAGGLGGGLYFIDNENSIEKLYTPDSGAGKVEREYVQDHFPTNDSDHFLPSRLATSGRYAAIIVKGRGDLAGNVLHESVMKAAGSLHKNITQIKTEDRGLNYTSVCARWESECVVTGLNLLDFIAAQIPNVAVGYPLEGRIFSGAILGGATLEDGVNTVEKATAFKLIYHLRSSHEEDDESSEAWERAFLSYMATFFSDVIEVTWSTSRSLETEISDLTMSIFPKLAAYTSSLLMAFAVLSCLMIDPVRSKPFLGMVGVLGAGMAVLATIGLMSYFGVRFNALVAAMPFLVIGVGVDNMFILLAAWRKTNPWDSVQDRSANTYAEAGVSITITSLTNALAFAVGAITSFPGVRVFCMYSGIAIVFAYLFQLNFFGACMIYDGYREKQNRHFLTCMKVPVPSKDDQTNCCQQSCCRGDAKARVGQYGKDHNDHLIMLFFKKYYGPFLMKVWVKVVVMIVFRYFSEYDVRVAVVVTEKLAYWDPGVQDIAESMLEGFEGTAFTYGKNVSESWLRDFLTYADRICLNPMVPPFQQLNLADKNSFIECLRDRFLKFQGFTKYAHDILFNEDGTEIIASRFFVQTKQIDSTLNEKNMMTKMRELASETSVEAIVYHPSFVYYDQYIAILPNTLQNLGIATAAMLVVSLFLMPHVVNAVWVTLAIVSICTGVLGFMTLWSVNLDSVSMINLIMCIGFSVDFSAHIVYSFVTSKERSRDARAVHALYSLGVPILQGSLSTILGVSALSTAPSYGFRTFFKTVFLVMVFGLVHGIVFLPVMLSCLGPQGGVVNLQENRSDEAGDVGTPNRYTKKGGNVNVVLQDVNSQGINENPLMTVSMRLWLDHLKEEKRNKGTTESQLNLTANREMSLKQTKIVNPQSSFNNFFQN
ncbi:patched domain-containing protein 3-like [Branchiostoma floridae]|uniref:Patched domain-containing protein 3 n=1 Tax=Branchiostoma floridae TaxID=7739 RepID=A0A9J7MAR3_BRAFL|nr:patched domain-containing protein 3-like [Branchiostoma floridae]